MGCADAECTTHSSVDGDRSWNVVVLYAAILIWIAAACAAQTSSSLVRRDPGSQYGMVKRAAQQLLDSGAVQSHIRPGESYNLALCQDFYLYAGNTSDVYDREPVLRTLAELALEIVILNNDLRILGYPDAVWRSMLADFENTQLVLLLREGGQTSPNAELPSDKNDGVSKRRLVALMNNYRRQSNPSLRAVTYAEGCGAGEFEIRVLTEPRNGRILFIPAFFYQLCRAQQLDPNDTNRCDRWHEALNGQLSWVAGDYYYIVHWPDGAVRQGRLSFNKSQEGQVVVIRKQ
jgi:hypothetical protein